MRGTLNYHREGPSSLAVVQVDIPSLHYQAYRQGLWTVYTVLFEAKIGLATQKLWASQKRSMTGRAGMHP